MRAGDIHARIGPTWPAVLARCGIPENFLRKKAGPCPHCGGRDRFVFDNRKGRGDFYCRQCGAGDGFQLLMRVTGANFGAVRKLVMEAAGLSDHVQTTPAVIRREFHDECARPTARVWNAVRSACAISDCTDTRDYLASRKLWPLPAGCTLRAHAALDYFDEGRRCGHYAALIAEVRDIDGELVTVHTTYVEHGRKLGPHEPRKLLSPLTGRAGCAVRLVPLAGDLLGVGEGIETCLAAVKLHNMPVWAALNTVLLAKFEPPAGARRLLVFGDRDTPGLEAAARLIERLQRRVQVELRLPPAPRKDWNDALMTQHRTAPEVHPT